MATGIRKDAKCEMPYSVLLPILGSRWHPESEQEAPRIRAGGLFVVEEGGLEKRAETQSLSM